MKKLAASILAILILVSSAGAATQAVLSGFKGKVEVKPDGGAWTAATKGMTVDLKTTISTGFDSTATILIDKSTIVVKPLTRLTLDKLVEQAGSVSASMFLRVGAVQASVKAAVPGTPQDFKVQSPYSTASVRGTEFSFDGFYLRVVEGVVVLVPGRPTREAEGGATGGFEGATNVDPANASNGVPVAPGQEAALQMFFALDTGAHAVSGEGGTGETGKAPGAPPAAPARSGIVITVTGP
ncbi:MAG TPA: FecR domain-containing protein [Rectinemataceae bacterium]|nr:FecR domain-containing protein [Rectinemataceae bacterium]